MSNSRCSDTTNSCHNIANTEMDNNRSLLLQLSERKEKEVITYKCEPCGKHYSSMSKLKAHSVVHTGERPFKCKFCSRMFSFLSCAKRHQASGACSKGNTAGKDLHQQITAEGNDVGFLDNSDSAAVQMDIEDESESYTSNSQARDLGSYNGGIIYNAVAIQVDAEVDEDMNDSIAQMTVQQDADTSNGQTRDIGFLDNLDVIQMDADDDTGSDSCYKQARDLDSRNGSPTTSDGQSTSTSQMFEFSQFQHETVATVSDTEKKPFVCEHCNKKFLFWNSLKTHLSKHQRPCLQMIQSSWIHMASKCQTHKDILHEKRLNKTNSYRKDRSKEQQGLNACAIKSSAAPRLRHKTEDSDCEESAFVKKEKIKITKTNKNMPTTTGRNRNDSSSNVQCDEMSRTGRPKRRSTVVSDLTANLVNPDHSDKKGYPCPNCDAKFRGLTQLKAHMVVHTREQPFACHICGRRFSFASCLKRHAIIHAEGSGGEEGEPKAVNKDVTPLLVTKDTVPLQETNSADQKTDFTGDAKQYCVDLKSVTEPKQEVVRNGKVSKHPKKKTVTLETEKVIADDCKESESTEDILVNVGSQQQRHKQKQEKEQLNVSKRSKVFRNKNTQNIKFTCDLCGKTFASFHRLETHISKHLLVHSKSFICEICGLRFSSKFNVKKHQQGKCSQTPARIECSDCYAIFPNKSELRKHRQDNHDTPSARKDLAALTGVPCKLQLHNCKCDTCGKVFPRQDHLNKHKKICQKTYLFSCATCGEKFDHIDLLDKHVEENHNVAVSVHIVSAKERVRKPRGFNPGGKKHFRCDVCGKDFLNAKYLSQHTALHTGDLPFVCESCGAAFSYEAALEKHQSHTSCGATDGRFKCKFCDDTFNSIKDLRTHNSSRLGLRFKCDKCDMLFSSCFKKYRHKDVCSQGPVKYSCDECGKEFVNPTNLREHQIVHTGEKPHACGQCGRRFAYLQALKRHLSVHGGDDLPYKCKLCNKGFTIASALRLHEKSHMDIKSRQVHSCHLCEKRFVSRQRLKRHMYLHADDKPLHCQFCGKGFINPYHLKTHLNSQHNVPLEVHRCKFCEQVFPSRFQLTQHQDLNCAALAATISQLPEPSMVNLLRDDDTSHATAQVTVQQDGTNVIVHQDPTNIIVQQDPTNIVVQPDTNPLEEMQSKTEIIIQENNGFGVITERTIIVTLPAGLDLAQWLQNGGELITEEPGVTYITVPDQGQKQETSAETAVLQDEGHNQGAELTYVTTPDESHNQRTDAESETLVPVEGQIQGTEVTEVAKQPEALNLLELGEIKDENCLTLQPLEEEEMKAVKAETCDITCRYCGESCASLDELEMHQTHQHPFVEFWDPPPSHSLPDGNVSAVKSEVSAGQQVLTSNSKGCDEKNYMCQFCGKCFQRGSDMNRHIAKCEESQLEELSLQDEPLTESATPKKAGKNFMCEECGAQYCRKNELVCHKLNVHGISCAADSNQDKERLEPDSEGGGLDPEPLSKPNTNRYPCEYCNKTFNRKRSLEQHTLTHTQGKGFKCNQCDKCYAYESSLLSHLKSHEDGGKERFKCLVCGNSYLDRAYLSKHMLTHTAGTMPFICSDCGKGFLLQSGLARHCRDVHKHPVS